MQLLLEIMSMGHMGQVKGLYTAINVRKQGGRVNLEGYPERKVYDEDTTTDIKCLLQPKGVNFGGGAAET